MFEKLYDSLKETPHAGQNPETVHSGEMLRLRNHKTCRPCREEGCAALTAEKDSFRIHALFHDSDIFNTAKVNNERTWTTGDVCEFFIQPAGLFRVPCHAGRHYSATAPSAGFQNGQRPV